ANRTERPMARSLRITLAQLNPTVGDIRGNAEKLMAAWEQGRVAGSDIVMSSEMFLTGYSSQDMVRKPAFSRDAMAVVEELAARTAEGPALGVGAPLAD